MSRVLTVAAAQLGPIPRSDSRARVVKRLTELLREAASRGCELVVFPELAHPGAPEHDHLSEFHNLLSMQAGAYANATCVVGVAKCGIEEGCEMIAGSSIIAPSRELVAQAVTQHDELVIARCDLKMGQSYKQTTFNFAVHRQPEHYRRIVERKGSIAAGA